ncbi:hypothetical protein M885DRAFT_529617 [Pelagophyceae sp. CCMP2097]|nr:hypothetical protein M885DRAFT_529617 [Pelagophyceae sp. CCMP2097]
MPSRQAAGPSRRSLSTVALDGSSRRPQRPHLHGPSQKRPLQKWQTRTVRDCSLLRQSLSTTVLIDGPLIDGPVSTAPCQRPLVNGPLVNGPRVDGPLVDGPDGNGPDGNGPRVDGPLVDGPLVDGPLVDGPDGNGPDGKVPRRRLRSNAASRGPRNAVREAAVEDVGERALEDVGERALEDLSAVSRNLVCTASTMPPEGLKEGVLFSLCEPLQRSSLKRPRRGRGGGLKEVLIGRPFRGGPSGRFLDGPEGPSKRWPPADRAANGIWAWGGTLARRPLDGIFREKEHSGSKEAAPQRLLDAAPRRHAPTRRGPKEMRHSREEAPRIEGPRNGPRRECERSSGSISTAFWAAPRSSPSKRPLWTVPWNGSFRRTRGNLKSELMEKALTRTLTSQDWVFFETGPVHRTLVGRERCQRVAGRGQSVASSDAGLFNGPRKGHRPSSWARHGDRVTGALSRGQTSNGPLKGPCHGKRVDFATARFVTPYHGAPSERRRQRDLATGASRRGPRDGGPSQRDLATGASRQGNVRGKRALESCRKELCHCTMPLGSSLSGRRCHRDVATLTVATGTLPQGPLPLGHRPQAPGTSGTRVLKSSVLRVKIEWKRTVSKGPLSLRRRQTHAHPNPTNANSRDKSALEKRLAENRGFE